MVCVTSWFSTILGCTKQTTTVTLLSTVFFITLYLAETGQCQRTSRSKCSRCPPGFGVSRRCTSTEDTQCRSCSQGFYSSVYSRTSPCAPCSVCGVGFHEAVPCTPDKDATCTSPGEKSVAVKGNFPPVATGNPSYEYLTNSKSNDEDITEGVLPLASFQVVFTVAVVFLLLASTFRFHMCGPDKPDLRVQRLQDSGKEEEVDAEKSYESGKC